MSFNFGDYLLKYEKWLGSGDESKGNHATDGKLDDSEISVFFSGDHFEIGSDEKGDATLSMDEFNNWYKSNNGAIEAFFADKNVKGNDAEKKQSMLDSILKFINQHKSVVAKSHKGTPTLGELDTSELNKTQSQPENPSKPENKFDAARAEDAARALYKATEGKMGTDEKIVSSYLLNDSYTSDDILMIMNSYQNLFGHSLMKAIQGDYSGKQETVLREKLYSVVEEKAQSKLKWKSEEDIPDDIIEKTKQLHGKFSELSMLDYMSQFNKFDSSTKAKMLVAYKILYPNEKSPLTQVTDKAWFGDEDRYVDGMIESLRQTANK